MAKLYDTIDLDKSLFKLFYKVGGKWAWLVMDHAPTKNKKSRPPASLNFLAGKPEKLKYFFPGLNGFWGGHFEVPSLMYESFIPMPL